jgi:hypothetical protein
LLGLRGLEIAEAGEQSRRPLPARRAREHG